MLNVIIRADASLHIGSGHIMRCLVLADALKQKGHNVVFATRPQKGDLITFIKQRGFAIYKLPQPTHWLEPESTADYTAWLQMSEDDDAKNCAAIFKEFNQNTDSKAGQNIDIVITDHYGIGAHWHQHIKSIFYCKVIAIDDLVRAHSADIIIDQTLLREPEEYVLLNPEAKALTGTQYAIINHDFIKHHLTQLNVEKLLSDTPRILLSMGGIDAPNVTLQVLNVINNAFVIKPHITVLLSPRAPHYSQVNAFSQRHSAWITHLDFVDDMAQLMCEHDIGIGAPGATSWERACIGLPSIVIILAENQHTICQQLAKVNAVISVDLQDIEDSFIPAYKQLLDDFQMMRKNNLQLCDGQGIDRLMIIIEECIIPC
jgi:UDP-2,4-diacetamido-2,4,6-trideoxy-beta-L-altropyranose hydrolase